MFSKQRVKRVCHVLLSLTLFFLFCSCESVEQENSRLLNDEAKALADKFWAERTSKCGDSTFVQVKQLNGDELIYQFKSFWVTTKKDPEVYLSDADRLNLDEAKRKGPVHTVEWWGSFSILSSLEPMRSFGTPSNSSSTPPTRMEWTKWRESDHAMGMPLIRMMKIDGQWKFSDESWVEVVRQRYRAIDCAKIPE